jgi:D-sedoheptulose 7-phosphate isomerase
VTQDFFAQYFEESSRVIAAAKTLSEVLENVVIQIVRQLEKGGKVVWFGNGGSASDAQHLSAELMGRFEKNRRPIASIALNTDTSLITALANDFGYESVFKRQIEGICTSSDVCIGISTSGKSKNILEGLTQARAVGATTIAFTGQITHAMAPLCDYVIAVPSNKTSHIQEAHIAIGQAICSSLEEVFFD